MEQTSDSDTNPTMLASTVFNKILNQIQTSNLNFQVQISPFSAFISLRKSFVKDKSGTLLIPTATSSTTNSSMEELVAKNLKIQRDLFILQNKYRDAIKDCEKVSDAKELENNQERERQKLAAENIRLREIIEDKDKQLEAKADEAFLLHARLENAEKDAIKHFSETKDKNMKLSNEISALKSQLKEDSEIIKQHKADISKATKTIKSQEKNIYNLTKKIENLEHKIETLETNKKDMKHEKDKLIKEMKLHQNKSVTQNLMKSNSTQTKAELNNNSTSLSDRSCVRSSSSFTQTDSLLLEHTSSCDDPTTAPSFECVICHQIFDDVTSLKEHVENEHEILINLQQFVDLREEDPFIRFFKSINIGKDYIKERVQYYPEDWNNTSERIKFRLLAQKKLQMCSKQIEDNLKNNDLKIGRNHGYSYDL